MSGARRLGPVRVSRPSHADPEGELYTRPAWLGYVWAVLAVLVVIEAADEIFSLGGPTSLYDEWFHDAVLAASAALIVARVVYERKGRAAWVAFAAAASTWAIGSIAWNIVYTGTPNPPFPTFADVLWLLWYPCMAIGIVYLVRVRIPHFELHRWMDGVAVMVVVLVGGFGLVVQPVAAEARHSALLTLVDFAYPVLDILLIGGLLGVYGLLGWRPDRMWLLIGLGTLLTTMADAAFAIQEEKGVGTDVHYGFVWALSALAIAYAAWVRVPRVGDEPAQLTGMRAVVLALVATALAAGIQLYAFFRPVGRSERLVALVALAITTVQIVLSRPRAEPAGSGRTEEDGTVYPMVVAPGVDGETEAVGLTEGD